MPAMRLRDVHVAFWLDVVLPSGIFVLLILLTALFFSLVTWPTLYMRGRPFCNPNGELVVPSRTGDQVYLDYNPYWDRTMFLSITLGFGRFSFPIAKAIDACWDIVVGKGGQLLLGITTYRVLRRSLALTMEHTPVCIPTVTAVATEKVSLFTVRKLVRGGFTDLIKTEHEKLWKRLRLSTTARFAAYIFVCTYVLAFGTFTSVMTGYQAQFDTYVNNTRSGGLTAISSLYIPAMVVVDASRVAVGDGFATGGLAPVTVDEIDNKFYSKTQQTLLQNVKPSLYDMTNGSSADYWSQTH